MKRAKKTIQKRTYSMKGAIPTFVSLVSRGANFTPFSQLRYSENEQFGQDVEIHRVEFSKLVFDSQEKVDEYLTQNNFEQYTVEEGATTWVVIGAEAEKFEDIQTVEYEDGVLYHLGKLKEVVAEEAPAAEVVASEEFTAEVKEEDKVEEVEISEEVVKESAEEVAEETTNEEVKPEGEESTVEEGEAVFTEEEKVEEVSTEDNLAQFMTTEKYGSNGASFREVFDAVRNERNVIPSFDMLTYLVGDCNYSALRNNDFAQFKQNLNDYFSAVEGMIGATKSLTYSDEQVVQTEEDKLKISEEKFAEVIAQLAELSDKVAKFEEKEKETIDEVEVLVQNSQSIQTDEIIESVENKTDEKAAAFAQKRKNDLFGL